MIDKIDTIDMITVDTIKYEEKYKTIFYIQRPN